jgi:hypothetical protein
VEYEDDLQILNKKTQRVDKQKVKGGTKRKIRIKEEGLTKRNESNENKNIIYPKIGSFVPKTAFNKLATADYWKN